jgi:hypothetical protein
MRQQAKEAGGMTVWVSLGQREHGWVARAILSWTYQAGQTRRRKPTRLDPISPGMRSRCPNNSLASIQKGRELKWGVAERAPG